MKSNITLSAITVLAALTLVGCGQSTSTNSSMAYGTSTNAPVINSVPDINTNMPATNSVLDMNTNMPAGTNQ